MKEKSIYLADTLYGVIQLEDKGLIEVGSKGEIVTPSTGGFPTAFVTGLIIGQIID